MKERKKRGNINNCQLTMPNIYQEIESERVNFGGEIYIMKERKKRGNIPLTCSCKREISVLLK